MEFKNNYRLQLILILSLIIIPQAVQLLQYGVFPFDKGSLEVDNTTMYYNAYYHEDNSIDLLMWTSNGSIVIDVFLQYSDSNYIFILNPNINIDSRGLHIIIPLPEIVRSSTSIEIYPSLGMINGSDLSFTSDDSFEYLITDPLFELNISRWTYIGLPTIGYLIIILALGIIFYGLYRLGNSKGVDLNNKRLLFKSELILILVAIIPLMTLYAPNIQLLSSIFLFVFPLSVLLLPVVVFYQLYSSARIVPSLNAHKMINWNFYSQLLVNYLSLTILNHYRFIKIIGDFNSFTILAIVLVMLNIHIFLIPMTFSENSSEPANKPNIWQLKAKIVFTNLIIALFLNAIHFGYIIYTIELPM